MRALLAIAAFLTAFGAARPADALLCTPILGCTCNVTAADLDFGDFSPFVGTLEGTGQVTVDCTGVIDVAPSVVTSVTAGTHGTIAARRMRAGVGEYLDYNIYTIENGPIWGNGTTGSTVNISGGLLAIGHWQVSRDMHAVVTPLPTTKPGHYTDTVVVRIVW